MNINIVRKTKKLKNSVKSSRKGGGKAVYLTRLEDSENLSHLQKIIAKGTFSAYEKALKSSEVIYVSEGKIVKEIKGESIEVIGDVSQRKVVKGQVLTI